MGDTLKKKRQQNPSYLIFILTLSVLAIIALAVEIFFKLDDTTRQVLVYADYAVCVVFFIDILTNFRTLRFQH
jgi:hypothetical protein